MPWSGGNGCYCNWQTQNRWQNTVLANGDPPRETGQDNSGTIRGTLQALSPLLASHTGSKKTKQKKQKKNKKSFSDPSMTMIILDARESRDRGLCLRVGMVAPHAWLAWTGPFAFILLFSLPSSAMPLDDSLPLSIRSTRSTCYSV